MTFGCIHDSIASNIRITAQLTEEVKATEKRRMMAETIDKVS